MRGKPEQLVPFLASARDAIYARLERPASGVGTAWIIVTAEEDAERLEVRFVGQRIHLEIEESVRQERLAKRA